MSDNKQYVKQHIVCSVSNPYNNKDNNKVILQRELIYNGNLVLVNKQYPLKNPKIEGLISINNAFPDILMKSTAVHMLQKVLDKIDSGNDIVPVSGFRSLEEQTMIYRDSLRDNGEEFTKKFVALPNESEHQTGLAIDLALNKEDIDFICPDFPYEGICQKFRETAPDFGFILRYAKEKEQITGISHEPWHFRYVGYPHSKIIAQKKMAFEEYIEFIKQFSSKNMYLYKQGTQTEIAIYYVPIGINETITIDLPEAPYEISGNNGDGIIVTVWRRANEKEWELFRN